jgi:hypothetical protein
MNRIFGFFFILFSSGIFFSSCTKEYAQVPFAPFYKLTVNGTIKAIEACGTSDYVAEYLNDTAVLAAFGCGGQRAGFYLKGRITDGTWLLDNNNVAWFDEGTASYSTDSLSKGTLTITSGNYQATGGFIPFIEGTFSFDATNKNTGQKITVIGGRYLLKKYQY